MRRRVMLTTSALALAAAPLPALAQRRGGIVRRAGWSPEGPIQGREVSDPNALDAEATRHAPVLALPSRVRAGRPFDLVVQIGVDPHVMAEAHYIDWVEVLVDDARAFVADLSARVAFPVVRLSLVLEASCTLSARAHCSQHGLWLTRRAIEVS